MIYSKELGNGEIISLHELRPTFAKTNWRHQDSPLIVKCELKFMLRIYSEIDHLKSSLQ